MMGRLEGGTEKPFYEFSLEDAVPSDHSLRKIDWFLDFGELRVHEKPYYSDTGQPSVDPELMVRMLIVGCCFGIRSERRLCEEVHLNLSYRWCCCLGWRTGFLTTLAGSRPKGRCDRRARSRGRAGRGPGPSPACASGRS